jgi:hypothetical protein
MTLPVLQAVCVAALALVACGPGLPRTAPEPGAVRCTDEGGHVACLRQQLELKSRNVQWQVPQGEAPAAGWPVVLVFHGSFMGTGPSWDAKEGDRFGAVWYARTTKALLESGYAVITPESIHSGNW